MSNKIFYGFIILLIIGSVGYVGLTNKNKPEVPRPGTEQKDNGRDHVNGLSNIPNSRGEVPTSGQHDPNPLPWQSYDQEIPDARATHNLEHGGVYISYSPDLPPEQINKIKALFFPPFSRKGFSPSKAIAAPRKADEAPIIISSWDRSLKLNSFDEEKLYNYYFYNTGKSPEPSAS